MHSRGILNSLLASLSQQSVIAAAVFFFSPAERARASHLLVEGRCWSARAKQRDEEDDSACVHGTLAYQSAFHTVSS